MKNTNKQNECDAITSLKNHIEQENHVFLKNKNDSVKAIKHHNEYKLDASNPIKEREYFLNSITHETYKKIEDILGNSSANTIALKEILKQFYISTLVDDIFCQYQHTDSDTTNTDESDAYETDPNQSDSDASKENKQPTNKKRKASTLFEESSKKTHKTGCANQTANIEKTPIIEIHNNH